MTRPAADAPADSAPDQIVRATQPRPTETAAEQDYRARLGMWVFLVTEMLLIGPLALAYGGIRLQASDAFSIAAASTSLPLATLNTVVLLTSSCAMAAAASASRLGAHTLARRAVATTMLLGVAFLAIKGFEYHHEFEAHLFPGTSFDTQRFGGAQTPSAHTAQLFFFLYFFCTGLHAVHMLAGLGLMGVLLFHYRRQTLRHPARTTSTAALYWHFVDVVWIFLYAGFYLVGRAP